MNPDSRCSRSRATDGVAHAHRGVDARSRTASWAHARQPLHDEANKDAADLYAQLSKRIGPLMVRSTPWTALLLHDASLADGPGVSERMKGHAVYILGETASLTESDVYRAVRAIGDVQSLEKIWRRQDDSTTCCYVCTFLDEYTTEYALKSGEISDALGSHVVVSQSPPGSSILASGPASSLHKFGTRRVTCCECDREIQVDDLETHFPLCKATTNGERHANVSRSTGTSEVPASDHAPRKGSTRHEDRQAQSDRIEYIKEDRPRRVPGTSARIESRDDYWDDNEGVLVNHYNSKRNPAGGYKYHATLEEEEARKRSLAKLDSPDRLPKGQGRCMCCDRTYTKDIVSGICRRCSRHVYCADCGKRFWPSDSTFGRICGGCWSAIKSSSNSQPHGRRPNSDTPYLTSVAKAEARRRRSLRKGRTPSR